MNANSVASQLREVITRLIETGLSVRQFYPSEKDTPGGGRIIGDLSTGNSAAMKNVDYSRIYAELEQHDSYHVKLPDGGLLTFQYSFNQQDELTKHRLGFFPPSHLPTVDEAPLLYENDELYGDIVLNRIVRFPIRFDFDPANAKELIHPRSHLTIGQFDNCRIPVSHPLTPNSFALFVLRNFYHRSYIRNKNAFDKRPKGESSFALCIVPSEQRITHLVVAQ